MSANRNVKPYRVGQVWKSRTVRGDDSAFLIGDIREVQYDDGKSAERVYGVLITGVDGCLSHERDLDGRSMRRMFKILAFDPEMAAPEGDGT